MSDFVEFVYDVSIKPIDKSNIKEYMNKEKFDSSLFGSRNQTSRIKYYNDNNCLEPIISNILKTNIDTSNENIEFYKKDFNTTDIDFYHMSYFDYLKHAYINDYGIEIAPWYLWHIVFFQIAQIVKNNSSKFKQIFTSSDEKITLEFMQDEIDIEQYTSVVRNFIPDPNTFDLFFPKWDQHKLPSFYNESLSGLFADMVQDFYECMIMGCSLPKVKIYGDQNDWDLFDKAINDIYNLMYDLLETNDKKYFDTVKSYSSFVKNNWSKAQTWEKFYYIEHCGSGHQESLNGDFRKLINYNLNHELLINQLPPMISRFPFQNINNDSGCVNSYFISGLIGSNITPDGYLKPVYDYAITYLDTNITNLNVNIDKKNLYVKFYDMISKLNRLHNFKNHIVKLSDTVVKSYTHTSVKEYLQMSNNLKNVLTNVLTNNKSDDLKKFMDSMYPNMTLKGKQNIIQNSIDAHNVDRLNDLTNNYNVWLGNSHESFNILSYNPIISLDQYLANKNEALDIYSFLLDDDNLEWFVNIFNLLKYQLDTIDNLNNIIFYTFDHRIYSKYLEILRKFNLSNRLDEFNKWIKHIFHKNRYLYNIRLLPSEELIKYLKDDILKNVNV